MKRTVTEKYRDVNEGRLTQSEFLRQLRQEFPLAITQYNSYQDAISILKNRGMLFEDTKGDLSTPPTGFKVENLSPDTIQRGLNMELEKLGLDTTWETPSNEEFNAARKTVLRNLSKDPLHYLNLVAGTKKGNTQSEFTTFTRAGIRDTVNSLKKVKLKNAETAVLPKKILKEGGFSQKGHSKYVPRHSEVATLATYIFFKFREGPDSLINLVEKKLRDSAEQKIPGELRVSATRETTKLREQGIVVSAYYIGTTGISFGLQGEKIRKLIGAQSQSDKIRDDDPSGQMERIHEMYGELTLSQVLEILDKKVTVDELLSNYAKFKTINTEYRDTLIKKAEEKKLAKRKYDLELTRYFSETYNGLLKHYQKNLPPTLDSLGRIEHEEASIKAYNVAFFSTFQKFGLDGTNERDLDYLLALTGIYVPRDKIFGQGVGNYKFTLNQVKDYFRHKEAVKGLQLKESIKTIIRKVLLTEAATSNLASYGDQHASVDSVPNIINSLENVVTEAESFIIKFQRKVQEAFDSIGEIKDADGIPIGHRHAASILEKFKQDMRPVLGKLDLNQYKLPEAPVTDSNTDQEEEGPVDSKRIVYAPAGLDEAKNPKYTAKRK